MDPINLGITKDALEAMKSKMNFFVDLGGTYGYQNLGVFENEGSHDVDKEKFEYKDGDADWFIAYTSESFKLKGSLMQGSNLKILALALGRDPNDVSGTIDTDYEILRLNGDIPTPPTFPCRATGKNAGGKFFAIDFVKAQVSTTALSLAFNQADLTKIPWEVTALKDEDSTTGYDLLQYSVEK